MPPQVQVSCTTTVEEVGRNDGEQISKNGPLCPNDGTPNSTAQKIPLHTAVGLFAVGVIGAKLSYEAHNQNASFSSPPPILAILTFMTISTVFLVSFPSLQQIDKVATVETFQNRIFPEYLSLKGLAIVRTAFAILVFGHSIHSTFVYEGWVNTTPYSPESKLASIGFDVRGFRTQLPFTSWCWNLIGISFGVSAYINWMTLWQQRQSTQQQQQQEQQRSSPVGRWTLRIGLLSFESVAPSSLLVSAVTSYVIWPAVLASEGDSSGLSNVRTLLWHNANVLMVLCEVAFMGGIPIVASHCATTPLFGCLYVAFTWLYRDQWSPCPPDNNNNNNNGDCSSQFLYNFMDTTLGLTVTISLLALLTVLMAFFFMLCAAKGILHKTGNSLPAHLLFVALLASAVCRFQD